MRTILDVYRKIYEGQESIEHEDLMKELAIEIGQIGQRIKMGKVRESDGDRLLIAAKTIEKEYSKVVR